MKRSMHRILEKTMDRKCASYVEAIHIFCHIYSYESIGEHHADKCQQFSKRNYTIKTFLC